MKTSVEKMLDKLKCNTCKYLQINIDDVYINEEVDTVSTHHTNGEFHCIDI